jgi:multiple sugar transport system permease protein/N,N'-diacetylchitobiose transport system permease protein
VNDKIIMKRVKQLTQKQLAYILIVPAAVIIFAIVIYPLINSFIQTFYDYNLARPHLKKFTGFGNYTDVLTDIYFWRSLLNTIYFAAFSISLELIFGFIVALLLNEDFFGKWAVRTIIIIPWAIPPVVNATIWKWIANSEYGSLNSVLYSLGIIKDYRLWLSHPFWGIALVITADVWKYTPLVAILLLAALQTIPSELYEAAKIDGANALKRVFYITIPYIKPALIVVLILRTLEAFKVFDLIFVMTRGGPVFRTTLISFFIYLETFTHLNIGTGATIAYLIAMFMIFLSYLYILSLKSSEIY